MSFTKMKVWFDAVSFFVQYSIKQTSLFTNASYLVSQSTFGLYTVIQFRADLRETTYILFSDRLRA